jgi:hypothetical protein
MKDHIKFLEDKKSKGEFMSFENFNIEILQELDLLIITKID